MQVVRIGMFETNSSSCHSFSFGGGNYMIGLDFMTPDELESGKVYVSKRYYGREEQYYHDVDDKLSYLFTDIANGKQMPHGCHPAEIDVLSTIHRVFKRYTGADLIFDFASSGEIDHESVNSLYSEIWGSRRNPKSESESDRLLTNFLFDAQSYIFTESDG